MKYRLELMTWILLILSLSDSALNGEPIGIADVMRNANIKGKSGAPLSASILPFKSYDLRAENEQSIGANSIRIVVIGCVVLPGVYQIKVGTTFSEILKRAGLITGDEYPVQSHTRGIELYRKSMDKRIIDIQSERDSNEVIADGDVLNVPTVTL